MGHGFRVLQNIPTECSDWSTFLGWALHRNQLPKCAAGDAVAGNSREWLKFREREFDTLSTCKAYYHDILPRELPEPHFYPAPVILPGSTQEVCLAGGSVSLRIALDAAISRKDWNAFHCSIQAFLRNQHYLMDGTQGGTCIL